MTLPTFMSAVSAAGEKSGNGGGSTAGPQLLQVNQACLYSEEASLTDIFGAGVQPGRALLDEIIKRYKAFRDRCFHLCDMCHVTSCGV